MEVIPAIDILGGKCVRLFQGNFEKTTEYKKTPADQAQEFLNYGFKNIHVIDLDGALKGKLVNKNIIKDIIKKNTLKVQVGGGVRTLENIKELHNIGVDKIVLGTAAVENIEFLKKACKIYKDKIALALDVRNGLIALSGWKKQTKISALEFIKKIENLGLSRIIYTDIEKDCTKPRPNIKETINLSEKIKIPIIISGGVSSIADIFKIKEMKPKNIEGIIIGKAIYDKSIELKELSKII